MPAWWLPASYCCSPLITLLTDSPQTEVWRMTQNPKLPLPAFPLGCFCSPPITFLTDSPQTELKSNLESAWSWSVAIAPSAIFLFDTFICISCDNIRLFGRNIQITGEDYNISIANWTIFPDFLCHLDEIFRLRMKMWNIDCYLESFFGYFLVL